MVNEPMVEPEGVSVDGIGGDHNMVDDVEDDEIRSPVVDDTPPERVVESSPSVTPGPNVALNIETPVEYEKPEDDLGLHENVGNVHGVDLGLQENVGNLHGEYNCHKETNCDNVGPKDMSAEKDYGDVRRVERENNLVDQLQQNGPTPMTGLGKRSRNLRSPPSDASMQGPPNRGFCHDPLGDPLFDLNRPSSSVDSKSPPEEDLHGDPVPISPVAQPDQGTQVPLIRSSAPIDDPVLEEVKASM
ncbi:hypothetical protein Hanom_Chr05g00460111 [Helianthus anomalus]